MDTKTTDSNLVNEAEVLRRTAERLMRAGLVVDFACLSPAHRRAAFALQCSALNEDEEEDRGPIGFAYPNAR